MTILVMRLNGKKVTVIGIGKSGKSAALLLKEKGAIVYATDSGNSMSIKDAAKELESFGIKTEIGSHSKNIIKDSGLIVVSPGVGPDSLAIKWAKELGIEIISEIELASRFCKGKIIAVTGTNGKSTTVTALEQIFKNAKKKTILCGNIGEAFSSKIGEISEDTYVVLEVSSFQFEYIKTFAPHVSVMLNITQDHLDRHKDLNEYFAFKKRIYQYQTMNDRLILNYDDLILRKLPKKNIAPKIFYFSRKKKVSGVYADSEKIYLNIKKTQILSDISRLRLRQPHNIENFMAASLAAALSDMPAKIINKTICDFKGLEHRMQHIASINGVDFINDSKATTVDSAKVAMDSLAGGIILIAGGKNKSSDFTPVAEQIRQKVKALVLIGEAKDDIESVFSGLTIIKKAASMNEAVDIAAGIAKSKDTVLLSPMCASFDMYANYKERGKSFTDAVKRIVHSS